MNAQNKKKKKRNANYQRGYNAAKAEQEQEYKDLADQYTEEFNDEDFDDYYDESDSNEIEERPVKRIPRSSKKKIFRIIVAVASGVGLVLTGLTTGIVASSALRSGRDGDK